MPSPFPGMNPYLEQDPVWHDFHERFCPALAELLTPQVRPDYVARIDEHVYIHELPGETGPNPCSRTPLGENRPRPGRSPPATGESARMRLLRSGQPRRGTPGGRPLAAASAGALAGHSDTIARASPGCSAGFAGTA